MKTRTKILGLLSALALTGAAASTYALPGTPEEQAACRPDVRKLCGNIGKASDEQYRACLQSHISELSQKCQQVMKAHQNH